MELKNHYVLMQSSSVRFRSFVSCVENAGQVFLSDRKRKKGRQESRKIR
jgi:hypothetical protein